MYLIVLEVVKKNINFQRIFRISIKVAKSSKRHFDFWKFSWILARTHAWSNFLMTLLSPIREELTDASLWHAGDVLVEIMDILLRVLVIPKVAVTLKRKMWGLREVQFSLPSFTTQSFSFSLFLVNPLHNLFSLFVFPQLTLPIKYITLQSRSK